MLETLNPRRFVRARIALLTAGLLLPAVVGISVFVGHRSVAQMEADKGLVMAEMAGHMANQMDTGVRERWREVQVFAKLPMLTDPNVPAGEKRALLETLKGSYAHYAWIGVADPDGKIVVGTHGQLEGNSVAKREWFIKGRQAPHLGDVHDAFLLAKLIPRDPTDPLPLRLFDVSAPIRDAAGNLLGVLCGHLSWDWSREVRTSVLQPLKARTDADILILNREGKILLGTSNLKEEAPSPDVYSVTKAKIGTPGWTVETWPDGTDYLTGYAAGRQVSDFPGFGWLVLVRQPAATAFAEATAFGMQVLAAGVIVALLTAIALWIAVGRMVRPLTRIAGAADRMHHGDTLAKIPLFEGEDEAATLSASIHRLVITLAERERELRLTSTVFKASPEGIAITDADTRILSVNAAFSRMTGYSREDVIGQTPSLLKSGVHNATFYEALWRHLHEQGEWTGEIWNRRKDGSIYPEWLTIVSVKDDTGKVTNFIAQFSDISERKAAEKRIAHLAQHDPLTDLPNRLLLAARLEAALEEARRSGQQVAMLFLDLDHFKNINDAMGHEIGDKLLVTVAARLQECLSDTDTLSRLGGDEFVVLHPGVRDLEDAEALARALRRAIQAPFDIAGRALTITASIGVSLFPDHGDDCDMLLRHADAAMYAVKIDGRDACRTFDAAMGERTRRRQEIEMGLRRALDEQTLTVLFQPQVNLRDGTIIGAECLVRWTDAKLGSVSPTEFIPIAEEARLIGRIGSLVLREACRRIREWRDSGVHLAVNVSALQLFDTDFLDELRDEVAGLGEWARLLEVEITESALVSDYSKAAGVLEEISGLGISLAIDDFGTGYSSLSHLHRLHFDRIKIDRSFISPLNEKGSSSRNIVEAILTIADRFDGVALAEGVETKKQQDMLLAMGCHEAQGFLYAKPMDAEAFARLLSHGRVPING